MYKIYINETKIVLIPSKNVLKPEQEDKEHLIARYNGNVSHLLSFIDMCEKTARYKSVTIHSVEIEKLVSDFEGIFKIVQAAGGVVLNERNQGIVHRHWQIRLKDGHLGRIQSCT